MMLSGSYYYIATARFYAGRYFVVPVFPSHEACVVFGDCTCKRSGLVLTEETAFIFEETQGVSDSELPYQMQRRNDL